jgi:proteic killer suppression protein
MIVSWKHKGLRELFDTDRTAKIQPKLHSRIMETLDALDAAEKPEDMNLPGYDFRALRGFDPKRYTVHVNGPWTITFEFRDGNAHRVDLEQYH